MNRRGFTIIELMLGVAVLTTMGLVFAQAFTIGIRSYRLTSNQTTLLSNARKALNGEGSFNGMIIDIQQARAVISLSTSTLSVLGSTGSTTTYTVNGSGFLRVVKGTAAAVTRARGLSGFQTAFYALSNYTLVAATTTASVRFATVSFTASDGQKSVKFYSGARVRNAE